MKINCKCLAQRAFTLVEVVIASAIAAVSVGTTLYGYVIAMERAEWSAYSLAAQSLATQRLEQCRACKWDPLAFPPEDELTVANFPTEVAILDIPISGTNVVYATNYTKILNVSGTPPLRMIRVDCVWNFLGRRNYTNSIATYRSPDQ